MVYRDPFKAGNSPKIPDGKCVQSLGMKKNATFAIDFPADRTSVDIVLVPGQAYPIATVFRGVDANNAFVSDAIKHYGFEQPLVKFGTTDFTAGANGLPAVVKTTSTATQAREQEIAKWRLVSGGMKIQSLTDCDDDGAWFEAFRFSPQVDVNNVALAGLPTATATPDTLFASPKETLFGNTILDSISEKGNYFAGKLNQLGRYPMKLNEVNPSHDFIEMTSVTTPVAYWDNNMDCIYVRIHGKPAPAAGTNSCCSGTKLLLNLVMNYELVLAEENLMHKLQTRSPKFSTAYRNYRGAYYPYYNQGAAVGRTAGRGRRRAAMTMVGKSGVRKRKSGPKTPRRPIRQRAAVTRS